MFSRVSQHGQPPTRRHSRKRIEAKLATRRAVARSFLKAHRAPHGISESSREIPVPAASRIALNPGAASTIPNHPEMERPVIASGSEHPGHGIGCHGLLAVNPGTHQLPGARTRVEPLAVRRARRGQERERGYHNWRVPQFSAAAPAGVSGSGAPTRRASPASGSFIPALGEARLRPHPVASQEQARPQGDSRRVFRIGAPPQALPLGAAVVDGSSAISTRPSLWRGRTRTALDARDVLSTAAPATS